jgi:hypothetical protein
MMISLLDDERLFAFFLKMGFKIPPIDRRGTARRSANMVQSHTPIV